MVVAVLTLLPGLTAHAQDGIQLKASRGPNPGEVRLDWTGGAAPYHIFRSADPATVTDPSNELGATNLTAWLDQPPGVSIVFYRVSGACVPQPEECDGVDNDCDTFVDEGCGTACASHAECAPEEHCVPGGTCAPDVPDGTACDDPAECDSGHCANGTCCASGMCCSSGADCAALDVPPACTSPSSCQGTRTDGVCTGTFQCTAELVADDSACDGAVQSQACGPYPPVSCTGAASQPANQAALCASSCSGDGDCDADAHCDGSMCIADLGPGAACNDAADCESGRCVDGVCCSSDCGGTCEACDLSGAAGTCSLVPDGTDPDAECAGFSCSGYYWGFLGDSCYRRADVGAAAASCDGGGLCDSAPSTCPTSGQGPSTLTCNALCQDPAAGTCTGTTAGACTNVNPGTQTCGQGVCRVTVAQCQNGAPNACIPNSGAASPETCNNLDDNCDGSVDNGSFQDGSEPNGSCGERTLQPVASGQTITYTSQTLYPSGDEDYYAIQANETDSTCSCCDFFCTDEDFRLTITLTVPADAGSYQFCTGTTCGAVTSCQTVLAGQSWTWTYNLDGACPGVDSYTRFVRIFGGNSPGYECAPYTLSYTFVPGCF